MEYIENATHVSEKLHKIYHKNRELILIDYRRHAIALFHVFCHSDIKHNRV